MPESQDDTGFEAFMSGLPEEAKQPPDIYWLFVAGIIYPTDDEWIQSHLAQTLLMIQGEDHPASLHIDEPNKIGYLVVCVKNAPEPPVELIHWDPLVEVLGILLNISRQTFGKTQHSRIGLVYSRGRLIPSGPQGSAIDRMEDGTLLTVIQQQTAGTVILHGIAAVPS